MSLGDWETNIEMKNLRDRIAFLEKELEDSIWIKQQWESLSNRWMEDFDKLKAKYEPETPIYSHTPKHTPRPEHFPNPPELPENPS